MLGGVWVDVSANIRFRHNPQRAKTQSTHLFGLICKPQTQVTSLRQLQNQIQLCVCAEVPVQRQNKGVQHFPHQPPLLHHHVCSEHDGRATSNTTNYWAERIRFLFPKEKLHFSGRTKSGLLRGSPASSASFFSRLEYRREAVQLLSFALRRKLFRWPLRRLTVWQHVTLPNLRQFSEVSLQVLLVVLLPLRWLLFWSSWPRSSSWRPHLVT
jgi:hypothetical protein